MAEIATNKVISKFFSLLEINLPFFSNISDELDELNRDLFNRVLKHKIPSKYLKEKYSNSLDDLVEQTFISLFPKPKRLKEKDVFEYKNILANAFATILNNRYNSRYLNYFGRHVLLSNLWKSTDAESFFNNTLPIFVSGYTPVDETSRRKVGIDPYSYRNYFTTKLLLELDAFSERNQNILNKLSQVSLSYIQPNLYIQFFNRNDDELLLEDITRSLSLLNADLDFEFNLENESLSSFAADLHSLSKSSYRRSGRTFSVFSLSLFDENHVKKILFYDPLRFKETLERLNLSNNRELINYVKKVSNLSKRVLAFRTSQLIKNSFDYLASKINALDIFGIPLYMEKTGYASKVLEIVKKDFLSTFDKQISFFYIGGEKGIFENVKDLPDKGICESSAIRKLLGFIDSLPSKDSSSKNFVLSSNKAPKNTHISIKQDKDNYKISYVSSSKYPFLLIEEEFIHKHPNLEDLAEALFEKSPVSLEELKEFFSRFKVGIRRIEPTLVDLFYDSMVNSGLLSLSNDRAPLRALIRDKQLILPGQIDGFFDKVVTKNLSKADFRLSLFSLPTNPKILKKYFNDNTVKKIDGGCPIDKYLSQDLEHLCNNFNSHFSLALDYKCLKEQMYSKIADIGTLVHSLVSSSFKDLIHYNTLERLGLPPQDSSQYCELPFVVDYDLDGSKVNISFHPDAILFLRDKEKQNNLDIIVLDTKTKSAHPYFEHKYLLQTYFYADSIAKLVNEKLSLNVNDYYLVISRLAFFGKHYADAEDLTYYRQQTLSPVIRISKDDKFREIAQQILYSSVKDLLDLKNNPDKFFEFKEISEKKGYCHKCFLNHQTVCNEIYSSLTKD